jgi:plastocyanin
MNQNLDSRLLNYGECYAMKFTQCGKAIYRVQPIGGMCLANKDNFFSILVRESSRKQGNEQQHTITIKRKGTQLYANPEHITIDENDVVLWHTDDPSVNTFAISSDSESEIDFNSARMDQYSVYSHAFGTPGKYCWTDAYGADISGTIEVSSPECTNKESQEKWLNGLGQENLVVINGNKVNPESMQITTGQTVIWAIEKAPGISITDARLLGNL